jgi:hypothetical protein
MSFYLSAAIVAAAMLVRPDLQNTIRVPEDYKSVQAAVDAASPGSVVLLAKGVHAGPVDMRGKAITLRGEWGSEYTSLLGGDGVIRCMSGEGPGTVIEGITIAGGKGLVCDDDVRRGGGVYIDGGSPIIRRCMIVGNEADRGAGVWIRGGVPLFEDCWFHDNISEQTDGVVCEGVAPKFIRCGFHEDGVQWADAPVVSIRTDCESPGGACCLGSVCVDTTFEACVAANGHWHETIPCNPTTCPPPCLGDTNTDRRVNHTDLLNVLNNWGMCR